MSVFVRDERGASIVTSLAVATIGLMLTTILLVQVEHLGKQTSRDRGRTQAVHVAEAGLDHALANLALDPAFAGETETVTAAGAAIGTYTTTVTTPIGAPDDRTIVSEGHAAVTGERRRVAMTVSLLALGSFSFTQKSASTLTAGQNLTTIGSTYARNSLTLPQHATINGDVISPGSITTAASSTINGLVWSGADVTVASGTIVNGNVFASGGVTVSGTVTGDVRAASITLAGGTIGGTAVAPASYPAPLARTLPTFTYQATNYLPAPVVMTSAAFSAHWALNRTAMSGTYFISDLGAVTGPLLATTMTGDLTIITAGPLVLNGGFATTLGATRRLTLISTAACCVPDAITWTGDRILPPQVRIFVYTTGMLRFTGRKTFQGLIEAQEIVEGAYTNVTFDVSMQSSPPPGFTWSLSSAGLWDLRPGVWRDCTATGGSC